MKVDTCKCAFLCILLPHSKTLILAHKLNHHTARLLNRSSRYTLLSFSAPSAVQYRIHFKILTTTYRFIAVPDPCLLSKPPVCPPDCVFEAVALNCGMPCLYVSGLQPL